MHSVARDGAELISLVHDLEEFISEMHNRFFDITPLAMVEHVSKQCRDGLEACIQMDKKLTKLYRIAQKGDFAKLKCHVERKPEDVPYLSEGNCTHPIYWACVANSKPFLFNFEAGDATINEDVNALIDFIKYTEKLLRATEFMALVCDELAEIHRFYGESNFRISFHLFEMFCTLVTIEKFKY